MPIEPSFDWEQTNDDVLLRVVIQGFKPGSVDVFFSDLFVKVNAPPTYVLALDLLEAVDREKCSYYFDEAHPSVLCIKLRKETPNEMWDTLCVSKKSLTKEAIRERREGATQRAAQRYQLTLEERKRQREAEKRRVTEAQWEVERQQRSNIELRVKAEREEVEADLHTWEQSTHQTDPAAPHVVRSPADIPAVGAGGRPASTDAAGSVPKLRAVDTICIPVDFTPQTITIPTRARGDEEYYRRSRYKPVSIEDSPMFWKDRGDRQYAVGDWKGAVDAYSESIKRDGVFLACVANRAACLIHMMEYKRAIEDCTLALTLLANTPASELTQERYRFALKKLHARRGAAYCWSDNFVRGVEDLRMAVAYGDADDVVLRSDLELIEQTMKERGLHEDRDATDEALRAAVSLYYKNQFDEAIAAYQEVLAADPYLMSARSNLASALLQVGKFKQALEECSRITQFCHEVAEALHHPGALSSNLVDSDDEDEDEDQLHGGGGSGSGRDELIQKRNLAAKKLSEKSGHVYLLLKAYVRSAAAFCGLKDYRKAHTFMEQAVRITPYDDDLRDDCNRIAEKVRMDVLVNASAGHDPTH